MQLVVEREFPKGCPETMGGSSNSTRPMEGVSGSKRDAGLGLDARIGLVAE